MTKEEIKIELSKSFSDVISWLENHDDNLFDKGPEGKWVTSQQLDHIHKTTKAINMGMKIPKLMLRWKFGLANRPSRSFDQVATKYKEKINNLPDDFKQPMPPKSYSPEQKLERISRYRKIADEMIKNADRWTEKNLDKYIMPHPAVGKITIREFLMWNIIHNEWHLRSLREGY